MQTTGKWTTYFHSSQNVFDRCLGRVDQLGQTTVNTLYTDFTVGITVGNKIKPGQYFKPVNIQEEVNLLKRAIVETFKEHYEKGLSTKKFHILDHNYEDVSRYGSMQYLHASPFDNFNVKIKKYLRTKSMNSSTRMAESVRNLELVMKRLRRNMEARKHGPETIQNLETAY